MATDYKALALQQLNPAVNQKIQALKNAALASKQSLDQSKEGINSNYDQQTEDQNMQNTVNKNNLSNSALGRGLGRSSIVTSGLSENDAINTKYLNRIASARAGTLNNIEQQKSLIDMNNENSIAQMNADLQNEAAALGRQLQDSDWTKNFQEKQFNADQAYKIKQFNSEQAYRNAQLSQARQSAIDAANERKQSEQLKQSKDGLYTTYLGFRDQDPSKAQQFLNDNRGDIIGRYGYSTYADLSGMQSDYMKEYQKQQEQKQLQQQLQQNQNKDTLGSHLKHLFTPGDGKWW